MKPSSNLIAVIISALLICSCTSSNRNMLTMDPFDTGGSIQPDKVSKPALVHFECLSDKGEIDTCSHFGCGDTLLGDHSFVIHLPAAYKTDSIGGICVANLLHAAEIANGSPDTNRVNYPYIRFLDGRNRFDTWVYVSRKFIPNEPVDSIKAWMLRTFLETGIPLNGLKIESIPTRDAIIKIACKSSLLQ